jgi:hypothetical protein
MLYVGSMTCCSNLRCTDAHCMPNVWCLYCFSLCFDNSANAPTETTHSFENPMTSPTVCFTAWLLEMHGLADLTSKKHMLQPCNFSKLVPVSKQRNLTTRSSVADYLNSNT